jgi:hypothetical protein
MEMKKMPKNFAFGTGIFCLFKSPRGLATGYQRFENELSRFDEPKNLPLEKSSEQTSLFKIGSGTFCKFF